MGAMKHAAMKAMRAKAMKAAMKKAVKRRRAMKHKKPSKVVMKAKTKSYEGAHEGCSYEGDEESHEKGHEVRMVAPKSGLTCLITFQFSSCCSACAMTDLKGFEARIWSITYSFRSAVCPAR